MIKKQKYFLLIFSIIFIFILSSSFAYALEAKYPQIPFAPIIDKNSQLPAYISYFFSLAIYLAGALAVVSMAVGGVQLIMSAESPENAGNAKDRIKGSLLGLGLTLAGFIILRTINPVLISPALTPLGEVAGVFYTNGSETKPMPQAEADTSNIPEGYKKLIYKCAAGAYSPDLLVWEFPLPNFIGNNGTYDGVKTKIVNCNSNTADLNGVGSFKIAFETPGVYFFLGCCSGDTCDGYMSDAIVSNQDKIADPFSQNIKSVWVVNDPQNQQYYGLVLHGQEDQSRGGECTMPIYHTDNKANWCQDVDINALSATIFKWNPVTATSGDGIIFYSEPTGWKSGAYAGFSIIKNTDIKKEYNDTGDSLDFVYAGVDRTDEYQTNCQTFDDCPGSIRIQGSYLVGLYKNSSQGGNPSSGGQPCLCDDGTYSPYCCAADTKNRYYCQVFTKDVANLKLEEFLATGANRSIDSVVIIPTK